MKFFVPSIGTKIKLKKAWEFTCFFERRNNEFIKIVRPDVPVPDHWYGGTQGGQSIMVILPAGTILRVDRIYVRKGKGEYDSISFAVGHHPKIVTKVKKAFGAGLGRFWAKLDDVNTIEYDLVVND